MRMNLAERVLIRSGARERKLRRHVEPVLARLGGPITGATVVEVGCGPGRGADMALRRGAARVIAYDSDTTMVAAARRRNAPWGERVSVSEGDAVSVPLADGLVDGVIELMVFHHVEDWQAAMREAARVLRPGGWFWFEDQTAHGLRHDPFSRWIADHPTRNRFSVEEFVAEAVAQGLVIDGVEELRPGRWFAGVAHKRV